MKKKLVMLLALLMLIIPITVKAENKVYFEKESITLNPSGEEKINVIVDSDRKFKRVSFNVISESDNIQIISIDALNGFNKEANNKVNLFVSETSMNSGSLVASVTIKAKDGIEQNENTTVRLTNVMLTSNDTYKLNSSSLNVNIEPIIKSNYLESLTSEIAPFEFKKDTLTYNLEVDEEVEEFDLVAVAESKSANVVISDQKLSKNKTTITIKVEEENLGVRAYKVVVTKKKKVVETTEKQDKEVKEKDFKKSWIPIIIILIGVLVVDVLYIRKRK